MRSNSWASAASPGDRLAVSEGAEATRADINIYGYGDINIDDTLGDDVLSVERQQLSAIDIGRLAAKERRKGTQKTPTATCFVLVARTPVAALGVWLEGRAVLDGVGAVAGTIHSQYSSLMP